jgi:hypothetical protein
MKAFLKIILFVFVIVLGCVGGFYVISLFIPKYHSCIQLEKMALFFNGGDVINSSFSYDYCKCNIPHIYYASSILAIKPPGLGGVEEQIDSIAILLIKQNKILDASNLFFIKVGTYPLFQNKSDFIHYFNANETLSNYKVAHFGIEIVYRDKLSAERLEFDSLRLEIKFNGGKNLISSVLLR